MKLFKILIFVKKSLPILVLLLFFNYTFSQSKDAKFVMENEVTAKNFSNENDKLVVFLHEGNTFFGEPDELDLSKYARGMYVFFQNGQKDSFNTYFPTEITVFFKKDSLNKTSYCKIYNKGELYKIQYPRLLENRKALNLPSNSYHPRELAYVQNIMQITRDYYSGSFIDPRDNQAYKTMTYNFDDGSSKTWMSENLNYKTSNSKSYLNSESNRKKYGLLYRIMDWREVLIDPCPVGWSLPTLMDWIKLSNHFGGNDQAGKHLKSRNEFMTFDFNKRTLIKGLNGDNLSGMNFLPAGYYSNYKGKNEYDEIEESGIFWSKTLHYYNKYSGTAETVFDAVEVSGRNNKFIGLNEGKLAYSGRTAYFSCRCIKEK